MGRRSQVAFACAGLCAAGGCGRFGFDDRAAAPAPDGKPAGSSDAAQVIDGPTPSDAAKAAINFVQTASASVGDVTPPTGATVAFDNAVHAGDAIVFAYDFLPAGTSTEVPVITDSLGDTYTIAEAAIDASDRQVGIAYAIASSPGVPTITFVAAAGEAELRLFEYGGIAATNTVDATGGASGASTDTDGMDVRLTTSSDNELLFGAGVSWDGTAVSGTTFTARSNFDGDVVEDTLQPVAGDCSVTATNQTGTSWTIAAATFRGL